MKSTELENKPRFNLLDSILLGACAIIVAGRCQINESLPLMWKVSGPILDIQLGAAETPALLVFAGLIVTLTAIYVIANLARKTFRWRATGLLVPLSLLVFAGIMSAAHASNKHTAAIAAMNLCAAMLMAVLLVQLLREPEQKRFLLSVIIATGFTMAYRCWEQYQYDSDASVAQFEANSETMMRAQGIEPGTYAAAQFAERVASRDIGGYFIISNTTASFFILAIMGAGAVYLNNLRRLYAERSWLLLLGGGCVLAIVAGMLITESKGGILAGLAAGGFAVVFYLLRNFLSRHYKSIIIVSLILIILTAGVIAWYGTTHNRLPSNSMWVRWQYWQAAGEMIKDNPLWGVGPENFGIHYMHYLDPAAPEVVKDPHSVPVAILSQWGILGLAALSWAAIAGAFRAARPQPDAVATEQKKSRRYLIPALITLVGIVSIRLAASDLSGTGEAERLSVYLIMFIMPALVWLAGFVVAWRCCEKPLDNSPIVTIMIGAGMLGFMLHNSIDMAFFQPGLCTCFFAMAALLFSLRTRKTDYSFEIRPGLKITGIIVVAIITTWFWRSAGMNIFSYHTLRAAEKCAVAAGEIDRDYRQGKFGSLPESSFKMRERAVLLGTDAWAISSLDPGPAYFNARLCYIIWFGAPQRHGAYFAQAAKWFERAIERDPLNYRYYDSLAQMYEQAADIKKDDLTLIEKSIEVEKKALAIYPGNSEMLVLYGRKLLKGGRTEEAQAAFDKALAIENNFLAMQREMWPEREKLYPRLTPELRRTAENK